MVSKAFIKHVESLLFPVKLYTLAHCKEIKSIQWSRDGTAVQLDTENIGKECFGNGIFNVADHRHVFRQLSYYGFHRIDKKNQIWEFSHPHFQAHRSDLVQTIRRSGKRNKVIEIKPILLFEDTRKSARLQSKKKEKPHPCVEDTCKDESDLESDDAFEDGHNASTAKRRKKKINYEQKNVKKCCPSTEEHKRRKSGKDFSSVKYFSEKKNVSKPSARVRKSVRLTKENKRKNEVEVPIKNENRIQSQRNLCKIFAVKENNEESLRPATLKISKETHENSTTSNFLKNNHYNNQTSMCKSGGKYNFSAFDHKVKYPPNESNTTSSLSIYRNVASTCKIDSPDFKKSCNSNATNFAAGCIEPDKNIELSKSTIEKNVAINYEHNYSSLSYDNEINVCYNTDKFPSIPVNPDKNNNYFFNSNISKINVEEIGKLSSENRNKLIAGSSNNWVHMDMDSSQNSCKNKFVKQDSSTIPKIPSSAHFCTPNKRSSSHSNKCALSPNFKDISDSLSTQMNDKFPYNKTIDTFKEHSESGVAECKGISVDQQTKNSSYFNQLPNDCKTNEASTPPAYFQNESQSICQNSSRKSLVMEQGPISNLSDLSMKDTVTSRFDEKNIYSESFESAEKNLCLMTETQNTNRNMCSSVQICNNVKRYVSDSTKSEQDNNLKQISSGNFQQSILKTKQCKLISNQSSNSGYDISRRAQLNNVLTPVRHTSSSNYLLPNSTEIRTACNKLCRSIRLSPFSGLIERCPISKYSGKNVDISVDSSSVVDEYLRSKVDGIDEYISNKQDGIDEYLKIKQHGIDENLSREHNCNVDSSSSSSECSSVISVSSSEKECNTIEDSRLYSKADIEEEEIYIFPKKREELVQFLCDQVKSGNMHTWDLFDSEDPLVRQCAYDALTLDVEQSLVDCSTFTS